MKPTSLVLIHLRWITPMTPWVLKNPSLWVLCSESLQKNLIFTSVSGTFSKLAPFWTCFILSYHALILFLWFFIYVVFTCGFLGTSWGPTVDLVENHCSKLLTSATFNVPLLNSRSNVPKSSSLDSSASPHFPNILHTPEDQAPQQEPSKTIFSLNNSDGYGPLCHSNQRESQLVFSVLSISSSILSKSICFNIFEVVHENMSWNKPCLPYWWKYSSFLTWIGK